MATKASSGPGGAQRKGKSAAGRATPGAKVGRYKTAEETGRYTPPVPRGVRRSPRWYGPAIIVLLVLGVLMILLNYIPVLPGSVTVWYLIGGLAIIFVGFLMATRYH